MFKKFIAFAFLILFLHNLTYANNFSKEINSSNDYDYEKTITYYEKECSENNLKACYHLGKKYLEAKNDQVGIGWLKKTCDDGYLDACVTLGDYYIKYALYDEAFAVLDNSCKQNHANSCVLLGAMYIYGMSVKANHKKGVHLYKKSCDLESFYGCDKIAEVYIQGLYGVKKDPKKGFWYLKKSCELGNIFSCVDAP